MLPRRSDASTSSRYRRRGSARCSMCARGRSGTARACRRGSAACRARRSAEVLAREQALREVDRRVPGAHRRAAATHAPAHPRRRDRKTVPRRRHLERRQLVRLGDHVDRRPRSRPATARGRCAKARSSSPAAPSCPSTARARPAAAGRGRRRARRSAKWTCSQGASMWPSDLVLLDALVVLDRRDDVPVAEVDVAVGDRERARRPRCAPCRRATAYTGVPFGAEMSMPKWNARDLAAMRGSLK